MLPGTVGAMLGWAVKDRPLCGAGERHPLAPAQSPWWGGRTGSREEPWGCCASGWGRPRAVDTGGDAVGSRRCGQTHLPGPREPPGSCFGIPGRTCRLCRLKSEVPAQIKPRSAPAPHHLLLSAHPPRAGDGPCITQNPPACYCPVEKARGWGCSAEALGGGWGLHPGEAQRCVPCPAGTAWHPSWSEAECVVGMPSSLVPLWVLARGKKSPPASQRD